MVEIDLPVFANGETVQVGKRIRLADGTLMKVGTLALTGEGWYVSPDSIKDDDKHFCRLPEVVGSPEEDSIDAIELDKALPVTEYLKKRAIDATGLSGEEKRLAVVDDLISRTRSLLSAKS